jgi:uncharacterized protein (DUF1778 family)
MARRDETPEPARPTYAMRLGDDERLRIQAAAARKGKALSAYVREAALEAARRDLQEA